MAAARAWRLKPSALVNIAGFVLSLAIALHWIPVPQIVEQVATHVQERVTAKPKTVTQIFPIEGLEYSPSMVTDRPGSPRTHGPHQGIDLAPSNYFRVVSVMDGVIDELNPDSSVGGVIAITGKDKQGNAIECRYVHLDRDLLRKFKMKQRIKAGRFLSTVSTKFPGSTGPHLHYERRVNGNLDWNVERSLTWTKPLEVARG